MQISLFLWVFLSHSITVGFAKLIFTSLIRISAVNPKSKHYVTFATPRVVPVRRAIVFICKSCPACQGYPTCQGETTRPPELSRPPRRVRDPTVNGWLNFRKKQAKCYLGQGCLGGRCLGCPRSYNWALSLKNADVLAVIKIYREVL